MNQITEQPPLSKPQREFSQDFIVWLVTLTIVTLAIVFIGEHSDLFPGLYYVNAWNRLGFLIFPWMQAGSRTIVNGLEMFSSGHVGALPVLSMRIELLISVLLVFVVGPTLLCFGWKKRTEEKVSGTLLPTWRGSTIMFSAGIILTASMAIPVIPGSIMQRIVSHQLRMAQAIQENRDLIINEANVLVEKAHQYRVLPKELQGGGGSFYGFKLAEELTNTPNATYTATVTDEAVTIVATSKPYPGTTVTVKAVSDFLYPRGWSFTGSFQ